MVCEGRADSWRVITKMMTPTPGLHGMGCGAGPAGRGRIGGYRIWNIV